MIVTQKQLAAMRSGNASMVFVPCMRAKGWKVGHRIPLWLLTVREEQVRTSRPVKEVGGDNAGAQVSVTVTLIGAPTPFDKLTLRDAKRAGFTTLDKFRDHRRHLYTTRERRDLVLPVMFALAVDRAKLLARRGPPDYTSSPHLAMRGEPEAMDGLPS